MLLAIPYLLGHTWLFDHARVVGPVLGMAYFSGTTPWWLGRADIATASAPGRHLVDAVPAIEWHQVPAAGEPDLALTFMRGRATWALRRWWGTVAAIIVTLIVVAPVGSLAARGTNQLIDEQPHQLLVVTGVNRHSLANDGPAISVAVPGHGTHHLSHSDYVHPVPSVGDQVLAVVDPHDPDTVEPVAYRHASVNNFWSTAVIVLGTAAGVAYAGWGFGATKRRAAQAVRGAVTTQELRVTLTSGNTFTTAGLDGTLEWQVWGQQSARIPHVGSVVRAAGDLRVGGWGAVQHRHWVLWARKALRGTNTL